MEKSRILFGIVCFREKFWQTTVFENLKIENKRKQPSEKLLIFIYDNTDFAEWNIIDEYQEDDQIKVIYKHSSENVGISKAYNHIANYAKENFISHLVFLDQDTKLDENFISIYRNVSQKDIDIAAPLIYSNDTLLSPSIYKNYRSSFYQVIGDEKIELKGSSCINSGLLIKTDFFHKVGGYDENLRLDFCDHEFIKRVGTFSRFLNIIPLSLHQDFSTNTNSKDAALFRYSLFTKDVKAFKKINNNDFKIALFVDIPHLVRLTVQYRSLAFIKQRFF